MSVHVRPLNFAADNKELLRVLKRNLEDIPHELRLQWLYRDNPAGGAITWFLCDESGRAVGVTSLFPRAVWLGRRVAVCGQVGDFGVEARFRSLGPAIMLQRATFEPVMRGELAFCYDCPPHEKGMAMFQRLGMRENCRMYWYAKLLRSERLLGPVFGQRGGRLVARAANLVLRLASSFATASNGFECAVHTGDFGPEFSILDESVAGSGGIRNRRSAEDLNWRYRRNPLQQFEVLTARRSGELMAYAVFSVMNNDAFIFDLFGRELERSGLAVLHSLSKLLRPRPVQTVRALLAGNASFVPTFRNAGFVRRGAAARVVAFAGSDGAASAVFGHQPSWNFQHCDVTA